MKRGQHLCFFCILLFLFVSCGKTTTEPPKIQDPPKPTTQASPSVATDTSLKGEISNLEKRISGGDTSQKTKLLLAQKYLNYGNSYYKEKEYAQKARDLLKESPSESYEVLFFESYASEITGNYSQALKGYQKTNLLSGITLEQKATVINQIGHLYDLMGDFESAKREYLTAEKMKGDLIPNLINRGRVEFRNKNYPQAKEYFQKVISLSKDTLTQSEMYYNISSIELLSDNLASAKDSSKKGIEVNPDFPFNYIIEGNIYLIEGGDSLSKAKDSFEHALKLYPDSSLACKFLGIYYYSIEDFEHALDYFGWQTDLALEDVTLMMKEREKMKNDGIYDTARSYAWMGDGTKTIMTLDKLLLTEKRTDYFMAFSKDFAIENGPFSKLLKDKVFIKGFKKYATFYSK